MNLKVIGKSFSVFLLFYIFLNAVCFLPTGEYYNRAFFPLFSWVIPKLLSDWQVEKIIIENESIRMVVFYLVNIRDIYLDQKMIPQGDIVVAAIPIVNQYIHVIIIFSLIASWPKISYKDRLVLLLYSLPLLVFVEMIDTPIVVLGQWYERLTSAGVDPSFTSIATMHWISFLDRGGRYVLSILTGLLVVGAFYLVAALRMGEPTMVEPCPCGSGKKYKRCCLRL